MLCNLGHSRSGGGADQYQVVCGEYNLDRPDNAEVRLAVTNILAMSKYKDAATSGRDIAVFIVSF